MRKLVVLISAATRIGVSAAMLMGMGGQAVLRTSRFASRTCRIICALFTYLRVNRIIMNRTGSISEQATPPVASDPISVALTMDHAEVAVPKHDLRTAVLSGWENLPWVESLTCGASFCITLRVFVPELSIFVRIAGISRR